MGDEGITNSVPHPGMETGTVGFVQRSRNFRLIPFSPTGRPLLFVGTSVTRLRTSNPSTGSLFHSPRAAHSSVNIRTSLIMSTVVQGVLMNPQCSAESFTTSGSSVMECREGRLARVDTARYFVGNRGRVPRICR